MSHCCPRVACKHSVNTVSVSVCLMLSILGPLCSLVLKLVLRSAFPITPETHKEARNRSRLWSLCDLTVTPLYPLVLVFPLCPPSLFQKWHSASVSLPASPCCKTYRISVSIRLSGQEAGDREGKWPVLSSWSRRPSSPPHTCTDRRTGWSGVHVITMLPLSSVNRSLQLSSSDV